MTSPMTPPVSQPVWLKLSPDTRSLALFVPLACLVLNGVLPLLPGQPAKLMPD